MGVTKTIICLANSRKHSDRCVAGVELDEGGAGSWIRPVSARSNRAVSEEERRYLDDGTDPQVLDVIAMPLLRPMPERFQRENWILDPGQRWRRRGKATWAELANLPDDRQTLWDNGPSTYYGLNDKIAETDANALHNSLTLIHVREVRLRVFDPGGPFGNPGRRVQAEFRYGETNYRAWVTDPVYEHHYKARVDGRYRLGECYLTISLGEPLEGSCYKLVAAIIERARVAGDAEWQRA